MTLTYWIAGILAWVHKSELSPGGWDWHQWQESSLRSLPPLGWKAREMIHPFFFACEGKQYANLLGLMCAVAGHSWGLTFTFLQTPSSLGGSVLRPSKLRASGNFSLICGPPEPPSGPWNEFISPQWDANDWCYNNITPCHNQLCILKREEMRRSVTFSVLSPAWKDNDFQHKCMKRSGSINTYCAQFFLTDFTRIFI